MTNIEQEQEQHQPKQKNSRIFKQIGIALGIVATIAVISVNGYLLFSEESTIEKSYLIDESRRVYANHHVSTIDKDVILAAEEEIHISTDATSISQVHVRAGQSISLNDELASINSDDVDNERQKLEIERDAYDRELSTLESTLRTLEKEKKSSSPLTKIDSKQIDEELNVTVQTEIAQSTPTEAIALVEQKIAEVERQIEIAKNRLSNLNTSFTLTSPVTGIVADVKEENGTVTFILYSDEKSLITYITEEEWKKIEEGQRVEIEDIESEFIRDDFADEIIVEDEEDEAEPIDGFVTEKQKIPTTNSMWLDELNNQTKLPDSKLFELRISPDNQFTETPFKTMTKVDIVINESLDAYKIKEDWIMDVKKKIGEDAELDELEDAEAFGEFDEEFGFEEDSELSFREEARMARNQLENEFDEENEFVNDLDEEADNTEDEAEEQYTIEQYVHVLGDDGTVRLAQVFIDFTDDGHAIITGEIEDGTVILANKHRTELSRTFLPATFELPSKESFKTFTWKDYVKYLVY